MRKRTGISQETLKILACVTMLLDHIGATVILAWYQVAPYESSGDLLLAYTALRMVGRISFPIYCFLLVEGAYHTRSPRKYAIRLAIGALLSEIPFDLAISGRLNWLSNNVMLTLLLGLGMLLAMERLQGIWKVLVIVPFCFLAEWLHTDYGGTGILLIAMLGLTRGQPDETLLRLVGFGLLLLPGESWYLNELVVPVTQCALLAAVPIFCYNGEKRSHSKLLQWMFYLFYPVHLMLLWMLKILFFG